jgi:D-threo-aldose 1-dehydrogenase
MNWTDLVPLGKSNLKVTRLGLGSAPLAGLYSEVPEATALAVVERAVVSGLRLFDTAPYYGYGLAERRLGTVLKTVPRDDFVLSTKVGRLLRPDAPPEEFTVFKGTPATNPIFDFSYDGVMRSVEDSLGRLGLDRLDVLLIHDPDDHYEQALTGAYPALERLRSDGTVGAIGVGMNQWEMLARFAKDAEFDCFLLAGRYTLLDQSALKVLLPICQARNIGVIVGGVFNSGILARPQTGATFNYAPASSAWLVKAQRIQRVCEKHGVPLKAAALQFPLMHPAITTVLTGCRSVAELAENIAMLDARIPAQLWSDLHSAGLIADGAPAL